MSEAHRRKVCGEQGFFSGSRGSGQVSGEVWLPSLQHAHTNAHTQPLSASVSPLLTYVSVFFH